VWGGRPRPPPLILGGIVIVSDTLFQPGAAAQPSPVLLFWGNLCA